jgi:hypothetical protein
MRMLGFVRTTLDIDEDVLQAAKELAASRRTTAGRVLSELARAALAPRGRSPNLRHGVPVLPRREGAGPVTADVVNRLRDDD